MWTNPNTIIVVSLIQIKNVEKYHMACEARESNVSINKYIYVKKLQYLTELNNQK